MKNRYIFTKTIWQILLYLIEVIGVSVLLAYLTTSIKKIDCLYDFIERSIMCYTVYQILVVIILTNINDIEKYRQKSLYVTRKNAVRLQRDEYFIADLIGLKVQDEDGTELGTVKDVIETGANDVYEVEMADGRSLLLPAIKQCILNVDVENGMMQVHVLEGLLDL